jgi:adenosylcobyric acid synthase
LYGTLLLLTENERKRVKGLIVNKFRGDIEILKPGLVSLSELCNKPVTGVLPYLNIDIEEEDSLVRLKPFLSAQNPEYRTLDYRLKQYDILASAFRKHLDLDQIYNILDNGCDN